MHLLILHQASVFGGAERTTHNLISYLDRGVVSRLTLAAPMALKDLLPATYDDYIDTTASIRSGWFNDTETLINDIKATRDILAQSQPDLALGMMHYSAALVALAIRYGGAKTKALASFRGPIYEYIRRYEKKGLRRIFLRAAITLTARLSHRIIVPSEGTAQDSRRRFLAPARRIRVIPNGIDVELTQRLAAAHPPGLESLPADLPRLAMAARLSHEKDISLVIEAMGILKERDPCLLLLVGDGPERAPLEDRARQLGLEQRIIFLGHHDNVFPYMRAADIYIHTCQFEGFGYAMLEAMACGTPVIATDCPHGPREVLAGGRAGILVPAGSPHSLADGISRLFRDPNARRVLVQAGLQRANELSIRNMVGRYQEVFLEASST